MSLSGQGKHAEAERMLHAAFALLQRGPAHPSTLQVAGNLEDVRARICATPPTNAAAPATAGAARPLPAGTRVLVQRLVAKPEHNGKRARVLSFDARTGRYAVSLRLEDGKELSLKAECVAKAAGARCGGTRMRIGGGEQRVLSMRGGAVLLARVPAHGLEGAQAGLHHDGGVAMSGGES
jgi:hypothetical protein